VWRYLARSWRTICSPSAIRETWLALSRWLLGGLSSCDGWLSAFGSTGAKVGAKLGPFACVLCDPLEPGV
jgi:hypothetical protein